MRKALSPWVIAVLLGLVIGVVGLIALLRYCKSTYPVCIFLPNRFLTENPPSPSNDSYSPSLQGAIAYYNANAGVQMTATGCAGAKCTFDKWLTANGFDAGDDASATYFNARELGLAREAHCRQLANASGAAQVACYVVNYGAGIPADPVAALHDASAHANPREILAIEAVGANVFTKTTFYAYSSTPPNSLMGSVVLDNEGAKYVPNACRTCHGYRWASPPNGQSSLPISPALLPFDVYALKVLTIDGAGVRSIDSSNTDPDPMQDPLRRLNALVLQTLPASRTALSPGKDEIRELIEGWYQGCGEGVNTVGCVAVNTFVPPSWQGEETYPIVRDHCRPCHIAQSSGNEFAAPFKTGSFDVYDHICKTKDMPNAEVVYRNFWAADAPDKLATRLGFSSCPR
jgi:hypothetical protein